MYMYIYLSIDLTLSSYLSCCQSCLPLCLKSCIFASITFLLHSGFADTANQITSSVKFHRIFIRHGAFGGKTATVSVRVRASAATPSFQALSTGCFVCRRIQIQCSRCFWPAFVSQLCSCDVLERLGRCLFGCSESYVLDGIQLNMSFYMRAQVFWLWHAQFRRHQTDVSVKFQPKQLSIQLH